MKNLLSNGLVVAAVCFGLAACSSKKNNSGPTSGRGNENTVAFTRANASGGSDLWLVGIDGASAPRRVTDNEGADMVDFVLEDMVADRVVFRVTSGATANLWSVKKTATSPGDAKKLTGLSNATIDWFGDVANKWLVLQVTAGGVSSLWSVAADSDGASAMQRLSAQNAQDVHWDTDWFTDSGWIAFDESRPNANQGTDAVVVAVDPADAATRRDLIREGATMTSVFDVYKDFVVMEETDAQNATLTFTGATAHSGPAYALSPAIPDAPPTELITQGIASDHLWYVRRDYQNTPLDPNDDIDNVFAVKLDNSDTGSPRNLSQQTAPGVIPSGTFASDGTGVFVVKPRAITEQPAKVFSTAITNASTTAPVELSVDGQHSAAGDLIANLTRVGTDRVVYEHTGDPGKVWGATLGSANSEVALGDWTDAEIVFVDHEAVPPETNNDWDEPAADRVIVARRTVTGTNETTNFVAVQPGAPWTLTDLTGATEDDRSPELPDISGRRGSRLVFERLGTLRSVDPTAANSEIIISDNVQSLQGAFDLADRGVAEPYVFFMGGTVFASARSDTAAPGGVRHLHERGANEGFGGLFGATDSYVVFGIRTGNDVGSIWSSPLAPATMASKDLSKAIDTVDVFQGLY